MAVNVLKCKDCNCELPLTLCQNLEKCKSCSGTNIDIVQYDRKMHKTIRGRILWGIAVEGIMCDRSSLVRRTRYAISKNLFETAIGFMEESGYILRIQIDKTEHFKIEDRGITFILNEPNSKTTRQTYESEIEDGPIEKDEEGGNVQIPEYEPPSVYENMIDSFGEENE